VQPLRLIAKTQKEEKLLFCRSKARNEHSGILLIAIRATRRSSHSVLGLRDKELFVDFFSSRSMPLRYLIKELRSFCLWKSIHL